MGAGIVATAVDEAVRGCDAGPHAMLLDEALARVPAWFQVERLTREDVPATVAAKFRWTHGAEFISTQGLPPMIRGELHYAMWRWLELGYLVDASKLRTLTRDLRVVCDRPARSRRHPESLMDLSNDEWEREVEVAMSRRRGQPRRWGRDVQQTFQNTRLLLVFLYDRRAWWQRDLWAPIHDSRIPVQVNEPGAEHSLHLWAIEPAWLREAMRLSLKSRMEAGDIRWSTVRSEGAYLRRFGQFLDDRGIEDPALGADVHEARGVLLDFSSALQRDVVTRGPNVGKKRSSESVRTGLHTVCGMYRWIAHNPREAQAGLDHARWSRVGWEYATLLRRGEWPREKKSRDHVREQLVPPEVLTQIVRNVHVMGDPGDEGGLGDRQAERLLLLIAKLGRRINEYLKIRFDCVAPIVGMPTRSTPQPEEFEAPAGRLFYNQTKIDGAPQSMLIDAETVAVIRAQQQYVRDFYASRGLTEVDPQFLFIPVGHAQLSGDRAYSATTLHRRMTAFAEAIDLKDAEGRRFRLSKVHRFRHTRGTTLAMMGVPLKVIQRDLGHAGPEMSAHYIALLDEDAEEAFYATKKFDARGREIEVANRDLWELMQLDRRADRILPNGWCLLPPLEECGRGNACLTCNVFGSDETHEPELLRQRDETVQLIEVRKSQFRERYGNEMPDDNVWLRERLKELAALDMIIARIREERTKSAETGDVIHAYIVGGGVPARDVAATRARSA